MTNNGTTNGRKPAKKRTTSVPAKSPAPVKRTAASEEAIRRCNDLDLTAAAWVTAIRAKVKELADEMGRLDYLTGHPDCKSAGLMLYTVLDRGALGELMAAVDAAEKAVEDLLQADAVEQIPNLARACRETDAALSRVK